LAISNRQRQLGIQASDEEKIASGVLRVPNHGALLNTRNNQRRAKRMARYHQDRRSAKGDLVQLMLDSEDLRAELSLMGRKSQLSDDDRHLYDMLYAEQREIEGRIRWIRQENRSLRVLTSELTKARRERNAAEKENEPPPLSSESPDARTTILDPLTLKEWGCASGGEGDSYGADTSMDIDSPSADDTIASGGPLPLAIPLDPRLYSPSLPSTRSHTHSASTPLEAASLRASCPATPPQTPRPLRSPASAPPFGAASPLALPCASPWLPRPARSHTPPASTPPFVAASPHALHPAGPPQPHNNWAGLHPPTPGAPYDIHPLGPPQAIGLALPGSVYPSAVPFHEIAEPLSGDVGTSLNRKKRGRPPKDSGQPVKRVRVSEETPTNSAEGEAPSTSMGLTKMDTVGKRRRKEPARVPRELTEGMPKGKKTSTKNDK
jgi:hypothetical protein